MPRFIDPQRLAGLCIGEDGTQVRQITYAVNFAQEEVAIFFDKETAPFVTDYHGLALLVHRLSGILNEGLAFRDGKQPDRPAWTATVTGPSAPFPPPDYGPPPPPPGEPPAE